MTVALGEAVGRTIRCPDRGCGAPARVERGRNRPAGPGGLPPPPGAASPDPRPVVGPSWHIVHCPRTGPRSFPHYTPVELLEDG